MITSTMKCLSLIMYMEARNQSDRTKALVASVAIERAKQEELSVCESMRKPRSYSWVWKKQPSKIDKVLLDSFDKLALKELKQPTLVGRYYFNECSAGKKFKTENKLLKSGKLCFY